MKQFLIIINLCIFLLISMGLLACELLDLLPVEISSSPSTPYSTINDADNIHISFSKPVEPISVETITSITLAGNAISVYYIWNSSNTKLQIKPKVPLEKGMLYYLNAKGAATTSHKKTFNMGLAVPFYYQNNTQPLSITQARELDTQQVLTRTSYTNIAVNTSVSISFNKSVDVSSFLDALTLSPSTQHNLSWNSSFDTVTIAPKDKWKIASQYTITISNKLQASDGSPLINEEKFTFLTHGDLSFPQVTSISRGSFSYTNNTVNPITSTDFNNILYSGILIFVFNKDIDNSTISSAFSISPSIDGNFRMYESNQVIFIPKQNTGWPIQTEYQVTISTSLKDTVGNALQSQYTTNFTTGGEYNTITGIKGGNVAGTINTDLIASLNTPLQSRPITAGTGTDNETYYFTIDFGKSYTTFNEKTKIESLISMQNIGSLTTQPTLEYILWKSDGGVDGKSKSIQLKYTGIKTPTNDFDKYTFVLKIQGGVDSINNNGSYIKEDQNIYVYTKKQATP